jgi:mannose-6-phosphate isomerase-like protein (cupin superfamily)
VFVLFEGSMTVRCGDDEFQVGPGDFVFLPRNVRHGFTLHSQRVRLLCITAPDDFSRRVETEGQSLTENGVAISLSRAALRAQRARAG